ncbi:acyl-CoA dehydrogenase family protein [Streptomyces tremellae]|uniref:Actinorhodin polyketide dimerase ActVA n=1 Tax=Streptomyces tremellae TaxID=1124239 RepID=A0ABP7EVU2_9ACTN
MPPPLSASAVQGRTTPQAGALEVPDVAPGTLTAGARAARDVAAPLAARADRDRCLAPDTVRAITDAGFPRHFVPRRFGGAAGGFVDFAGASAELACACAAAGWCASLYASHARLAAYLPAAGQEEIWASGPDARISAGFVPGGTARAKGTDYVLSGAWKYISGIDHADWALLCARDPDAGADTLRFFAVPRQAWSVDDTWFTMGLRGTGSRTAVLEDVLVPAHRTLAQSVLLAGTAPDTARAACHSAPLRLVNGLTMLAPALGASTAALGAWVEHTASRTEMIMGRAVRAAQKASAQATLARAAAALDTALLLTMRVATHADGAAPAAAPSGVGLGGPGGTDMDSLIARSHRDFAVAAEALTDAVERLQRESGTQGQAQGSVVERAWRDVHAATSHAALRFEGNAAVYARHVLHVHDGEISHE